MILENKKIRYGIKFLILLSAFYIYMDGVRIWNLSSGNAVANLDNVSLAKKKENLEREYGVKIITSAGTEAIPEFWQLPPSSGQAMPAKSDAIKLMLLAIEEALKLYPIEIIKNDIKSIYVFDYLEFYGLRYAGTVFGDSLYLVSNGKSVMNKRYLETLFHHEFSSILFRKYNFPKDKWIGNNPVNFSYAKSKNQVLNSIKNYNNVDGNEELYKAGFLAKYGQTSIEEDFNLYSETAFSEPGRLKKLSEKYPAIRMKMEIIKQFYLDISIKFSKVFGQL